MVIQEVLFNAFTTLMGSFTHCWQRKRLLSNYISFIGGNFKAQVQFSALVLEKMCILMCKAASHKLHGAVKEEVHNVVQLEHGVCTIQLFNSRFKQYVQV